MFLDSIVNKNSRHLTILWWGFGVNPMPSLKFLIRHKKLMIELETKMFIKNLLK